MLQIKRCFHIHPYALLWRKRCLSSSASPFDQSFTSRHVASDGRVFQFATVVVNNMGKDQSALSVWRHACSLVNANRPTLAITLLSKPTESSLAAVREFAQQFSHGKKTGTGLGHESLASSREEPPSHSNPSSSSHPLANASPPPQSNRPGECVPHDDPPQSLMSMQRLKDMNEAYTKGSSYPMVESELASVPPLIGCIIEDQGRVVMTTSIIRANTEFGGDLLWIEAPDDPDSGRKGSAGSKVGGDTSTVSEDSSTDNMQSQRNMKSFDTFDKQPSCSESGQVVPSKMNAEDESTYSNWEDLIREYDQLKLRSGANENSKEGFAPEPGLDIILDEARGKGSTVEDVERTHEKRAQISHGGENLTQGSTDGSISQEDKGAREDETYRLLLCVASMPEVKATGFYTRTTGLPWLPDLGNAVKVNNPHMLLLSAPGYNISEFIERLATMFPKGSRAGASLLTINDTKKQGARDDNAHIFCGFKLASTGAVGLSLSSTGEASFIPVDAFAEFVRMSLGMPPVTAWETYFDEAVSKSLFLPQRGKVEWLDTYQRAYQINPESVLDKMYAKLQHSYGDDAHSGEAHPKSSVAEAENLSVISVDKVLFPGFFIPLFIESPRDRLMVKQCMEQCKPFGVSSLCTELSFNPIGCQDIVGTIVNMKVNLFDKDCKSYIIAHGVRRFRAKNRRLDVQPGTFGQLAAQVEFFDDHKIEDHNEVEEVLELARRALQLCQQLFPSAASILSPGKPFQDPVVASFAVSHILPVSAEVKNRWLGMVDTKYRLTEQITFLHA